MGEIIRHPALSDQPEPALVDHYGRKAGLYSFSYIYADAEFSFSLWAYSKRDAKRRLRAIRRGLALDGQLYAAGDGIRPSALSGKDG